MVTDFDNLPYKCTNCSNEDRGEQNTWYNIIKFGGEDDKICSICNGDSEWGK